MPVTRRQLMAALVTPSLAARPVQAQARRYAALSLLADQFDVVYARESTGSHFDRNRRRSFDAGAGTFDRIALQAVQRALQSAEPGTQLTMLSLPTTSRLYQEPDRIFDGKSVVLPGAVVDALDTAKATHLLLLTKVRADALVPLVDGATGFGTVRGLGFYVDANTRFTLRSTGETSAGVLAPFAYMRLSLVDVATGDIVRDQLVRAMRPYFAAGVSVVDPWDVLNADQKVEALKQLLESEVGKAVPTLIGSAN
jgi:hypothetical protein